MTVKPVDMHRNNRRTAAVKNFFKAPLKRPDFSVARNSAFRKHRHKLAAGQLRARGLQRAKGCLRRCRVDWNAQHGSENILADGHVVDWFPEKKPHVSGR